MFGQSFAFFAQITPNDTTDLVDLLGFYPQAIYTTVAENLVVMDQRGITTTFTGLETGLLPIAPKRVLTSSGAGTWIALGNVPRKVG